LAAPEFLPDAARLRRLVDRCRDAAVVVFADLVADRFLTGRPRRISREAPVVILDLEDDRLLPGGGANAAANIRSLGGRPLLFGAVGDDASGAALAQELEARGIDVSRVCRRRGFVTPTKTRILGGGPTGIKQQIVRLDSGRPQPADERERAAQLDRLGRDLAAMRASSGGAILVLSDYGYGWVDPDLLDRIRAIAGERDCVLVDSRHRLGEFRSASGATPNQEEAEALCGHPLDEDEAVLRAGPRLLERLGCDFLLVTRGSRGMALFERGRRRALLVPVHGSSQVADVTGAGDTVIGTLALALAAGAEPPEAAILANFAGGTVVMKSGTATLEPAELHAAISAGAESLARLRWVAW
jgi:rfaE bifunctional protein kinase chain/domain